MTLQWPLQKYIPGTSAMKNFLRISGIGEFHLKQLTQHTSSGELPHRGWALCPVMWLQIPTNWIGLVTWPESSQAVGHSVTYDVAQGEEWRLEGLDSLSWEHNLRYPGKANQSAVAEGEALGLWSRESLGQADTVKRSRERNQMVVSKNEVEHSWKRWETQRGASLYGVAISFNPYNNYHLHIHFSQDNLHY